MPDISMCQPSDCSIKEDCYRFKAVPDKIQSYADFSNDCWIQSYRNCIPMSNSNIENNLPRVIKTERR